MAMKGRSTVWPSGSQRMLSVLSEKYAARASRMLVLPLSLAPKSTTAAAHGSVAWTPLKSVIVS